MEKEHENISETLLDIAQAAEYLGVNKTTLRRWDKIGLLKATRIGSRRDRRYTLGELNQILTK